MTSTTPNDMNKAIIEEFRANAGQVGGWAAGMPLVLLTTTGAKTGRSHTTPAAYRRKGDRVFVFASMAGAPTNPAWYHNLVANPTVTVELGAERFEATATPLPDPERAEVYAAQSADIPQFGEYQKMTTRKIPVVELLRAG